MKKLLIVAVILFAGWQSLQQRSDGGDMEVPTERLAQARRWTVMATASRASRSGADARQQTSANDPKRESISRLFGLDAGQKSVALNPLD